MASLQTIACIRVLQLEVRIETVRLCGTVGELATVGFGQQDSQISDPKDQLELDMLTPTYEPELEIELDLKVTAWWETMATNVSGAEEEMSARYVDFEPPTGF